MQITKSTVCEQPCLLIYHLQNLWCSEMLGTLPIRWKSASDDPPSGLGKYLNICILNSVFPHIYHRLQNQLGSKRTQGQTLKSKTKSLGRRKWPVHPVMKRGQQLLMRKNRVQKRLACLHPVQVKARTLYKPQVDSVFC